MYECLNLENDDKIIPFEEVKKLIDFLEYGCSYRIAITILALTGARVSEIEKMFTTSFIGDFLIWKPGKNQKGIRKEKLPSWFLSELDFYIQNNNFVDKKLFSFDSNSLSTFVNKKVRFRLGGCWILKRPRCKGSLKGAEYVYQLKNLRHNFASLDFARNIDKWGKDMAIEFTAKRMKHSSYKMTAGHYIENFEALKINRYKHLSMDEILKNGNQSKLMEFF